MTRSVGTALLLANCWLVFAHGQIIFPDEFVKLQNSQTNNDPLRRPPFPTLPSHVASSLGFISDNAESEETQNFGDSTVSGGVGLSSPPMFTPSGYDLEAAYWSNHVDNLIARGVTKFSLDMDNAIQRTQTVGSTRDKKNIIFSPLSIASTLAMVLLGSAGVTFEEVARILGLGAGVDISQHSEIVHQMFGFLLESIDRRTTTNGPHITSASGIFVQSGYPIRPEFKAIGQNVYKNEVINLDFIGRPNDARQAVNDWVKTRTNGKIMGILTQPLDPDTKVILASALYFSGEWNRHFIRSATKKKPFMVTPTESIVVDMMYGGGDFPFYEDKQLGVKIVALPYKGYTDRSRAAKNFKYQTSMYVLLPTSKDADALSNLESRLTPETLDNMLLKMVNRTCILGFPRMKLSSTLNLNEALHSLGLRSLFDPSMSNLGLLSPGLEAPTNPSITSRIGDDEENRDNPLDGGTNTAVGNFTVNPSTKTNYFRYEDKKGGYTVQQWNNGVIIEKTRRGNEGKRSTTDSRSTRTNRQSRKRSVPAERFTAKSNGDKIESPAVSARTKRQSRPIDNSFVRFLQSRQMYSKFGLDELRNSPNIRNPGLFASDVLHKVEMDVTELGTVAAAATTVLLQRGGDIQRFITERPFLFFIRHEPSRLMLFWGTVYRPTPNY